MGSPQVINCTVSTVSGVESSSVMISWMGPGGNIDATNGRVSIGSVTDDSNNMYTRSLQFTYLMEGDEGKYTCNVMILETSSESDSVDIQLLTSKLQLHLFKISLLFTTVPTPTVSITAPNTQTVGQSLRLECNGTTVRGVTSDVEIVWRRGGTVVQMTRVTAATTTMSNLLVYRDSYTISQLNTSDDDIKYKCRLVIRARSVVRADTTVTLDVIGEYFP